MRLRARVGVPLGVTKQQRLAEIIRRLAEAAPFRTGADARMALEEIMRDVEDEYSGVPENPHAATAPADGRMYAPDDRFEIASGSPSVRTFKQRRHRTSFGENGAILIQSSEGHTVVDLAGEDGRTVDDLICGGKR